MRQCVYFIGAENEGPIKIGHAKNVPFRLKEIQTGNPHKLVIHGVLLGKTGLEGAMHAKFADFRLQGEWFERHPALIEFIAKHTLPADSKLWLQVENKTKVVYRPAPPEELEKTKAGLRKELVGRSRERVSSWLSAHLNHCLRTVYRLYDLYYDSQSTFNTGESKMSLHDVEQIRIEIRQIIDHAMGCNWNESRGIINNKKLIDRGDCEQAARRLVGEWMFDA